MRLLVVAARSFRPGGKGDQIRLMQVVAALAADHEVTVLQPADEGTAAPPHGARIASVRLTAAERAAGALAAWLRGRPAQIGWCAPWRFARAIRRQARRHDAVLFVTSRVFVPGAAARVAVDHVDALSENARRRSTTYRLPLVRLLWRSEARRLRRWERRAAHASEVQLVTSPADAGALPPAPAPVVVPVGVDLDAAPEPVAGARDIDVIFTGDMRYPPNRDAAQWLATDIAPRLRARRPATRVVVAGRFASTLPPLDGVDVVSDVPDLGAWLARSKVAVAPLRLGTGVPNKVLEAARAGAAVALTPDANAGLGLPATAAAVGDSADELATEVAVLLDEPAARDARATALRRELERFDLPAVGARYVAALAGLRVAA